MKEITKLLVIVPILSVRILFAQDGVFLQTNDEVIIEGTSFTKRQLHGVTDDSRFLTFYQVFSLSTGGSRRVTGIIDTYAGKVHHKTNYTSYYSFNNALFIFEGEETPFFDKELIRLNPITFEPEVKVNKVNYNQSNTSISNMDYFQFFHPYQKPIELHYINPTSLERSKVHSFDLDAATIDWKNKQIVGVKTVGDRMDEELNQIKLMFYDLETFELLKETAIVENESKLSKTYLNSAHLDNAIRVSEAGDIFVGCTHTEFKKKKIKHTNTNMVDYSLEKVLWISKGNVSNIKELNTGNIIDLSKDGKTLVSLSPRQGKLNLWDLETSMIVYEHSGTKNDNLAGNFYSGKANLIKINKGSHFILAYTNGVSSIISGSDQKEVGIFFTAGKDWAVIASDGRVEGTQGAFDKLEWHEYRNDVLVSKTSPSFNNYYTPRLFQELVFGDVGDNQDFINYINQRPSVEITYPSTDQSTDQKKMNITVKGTSNGDPIKEIQLFVNNKLVGGGERGFKVVESNEKTFEVLLVEGENTLTAKAISQKNYESDPQELTITYTGPKITADLHILAVGLDEYKNSTLNLNYAIADADGVTRKIKTNSTDIFNNTYVYKIYNNEATKSALIDQFKQVASATKPEDVFVFFYAGHGVMSEGVSNDFFLALHDVTQLYGKEDLLLTNGLSATELKRFTSNIKAQKQVILLDACQSGGAVKTFASRGMAEEKAVVQLARSSGAILLSSTGSEQLATEFAELGHGVFTYALLQGMDGKADGGTMDGKITVKELESYLNDQIPILTEKYKGRAQYPRAWSSGQDFPLVIKR